RLRQALPGVVPSWEIVVADDGSQDRTREIVEAEARNEPRIRLLALPHHGKGQAVRRGLLEAQGEWRYIADADLATPPDNLTRFLAHTQDADSALVIGSREAPGSTSRGFVTGSAASSIGSSASSLCWPSATRSAASSCSALERSG